MCIAIPGQIVKLDPARPEMATVDIQGQQYEISLALIPDDAPGPGDWVLVYAGCAMAKVDEATARDALAFLEEIQAAYDEAFSPT